MKKQKLVVYECPSCHTKLSEGDAENMKELQRQKLTIEKRALGQTKITTVPCPNCTTNMVRRVTKL